MIQISDNASKLILKMTLKNGIPGGGLRIGIKAGGFRAELYVRLGSRAARRRSGVRRVRGVDESSSIPDYQFQFIQGTTLDYDTTSSARASSSKPERQGLVCCGTSFSI